MQFQGNPFGSLPQYGQQMQPMMGGQGQMGGQQMTPPNMGQQPSGQFPPMGQGQLPQMGQMPPQMGQPPQFPQPGQMSPGMFGQQHEQQPKMGHGMPASPLGGWHSLLGGGNMSGMWPSLLSGLSSHNLFR